MRIIKTSDLMGAVGDFIGGADGLPYEDDWQPAPELPDIEGPGAANLCPVEYGVKPPKPVKGGVSFKSFKAKTRKAKS